MRRALLVMALLGCSADGGDEGAVERPYAEAPRGAVEPTAGGNATLRPGPEVERPPPCADDADGDGYGASADCAGPDCDEANRNVHPGALEACNAIDEDCDGVVDEGLPDAACGLGACRRSVASCVDGRAQRCTPLEGRAEACNDVDDDCDGEVDEDVGAMSCGVGACQRQAPCAAGATGECVPGAPEAERCDGVDQDCDGTADEGFRAFVHETTYSALRERHAVCNGSGQRIGPDCNAAMNRWCGARACETTGFGPVENTGDSAWVTCVTTDLVREVSFAELSAQHGPCNGAPQRIGPDCNAAIHRWCGAQPGYVSGFGPVESGADVLVVACVRPEFATPVGTRYSVLTGFHPPCDGSTQRIGPDCNAAIHRFCRDEGYVSGYGPAENFGDELTVVCLSQ